MKLIIKISLISVLFFIFSINISNSAVPEDSKEVEYRYNIAANTSNLITIRNMFGQILQSGDLDYSFNASKKVLEMLDKIGKDLDTIEVPEDMEGPYNVFLESVRAYRKSAACIRNAMEIMLGFYDGSDKEVNELIKKSSTYVETANKYFDLSINLHSEAFKDDKNSRDFFSIPEDSEKDFKSSKDQSTTKTAI